MESPKTEAVDRLPWRKPQVRRLVVNADTKNSPGSGPDLQTFGINIAAEG